MDFSQTTATVAETVTNAPLDVIVVLALIVAFCLYGRYAGKSRLVSFILGIYPGMLLYTFLPSQAKALFADSIFAQCITFFAIIALIAVLLRRVVHSSFTGSRMSRWFESILLAVFAVGLLVVAGNHVLPESGLPLISSELPFVTAPGFLFWWLIAPLMAVIFLTRKEE